MFSVGRVHGNHIAHVRGTQGWPLRGLHVDVRFESKEKEGMIARVLSFEGDLNNEQRARLADIAERTPVTLTLKQGVVITTSVV